MEVKIVEHTQYMYGVYFSEKELRHLRRIAADQATTVRLLIKSYIRSGFADCERYVFSRRD